MIFPVHSEGSAAASPRHWPLLVAAALLAALPGSVAQAANGEIELRVVDEQTGDELPGQHGQLQIGARLEARGWWLRIDETREPGMFRCATVSREELAAVAERFSNKASTSL